MKKLLCIISLLIILACALTSCDVITGMIIKHNVTFDLNGGVADEGFNTSVEIGNGQTLTLTAPTREGYDFLGWYSGKTEITEETPITEDLKLKAEWKVKSFKVSFLDYYGNTVSTQTVNYGESAAAPTVESVVNKLRFDGWSADFSDVVSDMTVNALYVDNTYTISYDLGEISESFTEPCFYGDIPKIPEAPVVDGYVFMGWYTDEKLTDRYFFDYKLDTDTTLYAKFYDTSLGEYIVISNVDQLLTIPDQPNAKYLLACDINCHGEILTSVSTFGGELNGNGYKIHNFSISESSSITVGFIQQNNGIVKDLSFADYTMDTATNTVYSCAEGIIIGINNGNVVNCHILDSEIKINHSACGGDNSYFGTLIGRNTGTVEYCSNSAIINVDIKNISTNSPIFSIGGIVGLNEPGGKILKCENNGKIILKIATNLRAASYCNIGGICGTNHNLINESVSNAIITVSGDAALINIGGAIGCNYGKAYNCYSTGDISCSGEYSLCVGGFVGFNELTKGYPATINKCFSTSNITVNNDTAICGYFAGKDTGTIKDCYYLDAAKIWLKTVVNDVEETSEFDPTVEIGEAKSSDDLLSMDFLTNLMYFDRMVWWIVEGQLPTLR